MSYLSHLASQTPTAQPLPASMARLMGAAQGWSADVLGDFSLRMASHGLSVSSTMMRRDPRYALGQLHHAHSLADETLHQLADSIARELERRQAEVEPVS